MADFKVDKVFRVERLCKAKARARVDRVGIVDSVDRVDQVDKFDTVKLVDRFYHVDSVDSWHQAQSLLG